MTRQPKPKKPTESKGHESNERGSALILAIFVLVILASMGIALLFLSQSEVKMSRSDIRSKQVFYIAESGLENGRIHLYHTNGREEFDNDLIDAAGVDGAFGASPDTLRPVYDTDGNVTGFTGYGDDVPLLPFVPVPGGAAGSGGYAAFLSNDSADVGDPLDDTNQRVLLTAVGAGSDGSVEVVQAIVEYREIFPLFPPAAVTILGPSANFVGGTSNAKQYIGDDCNGVGGIPGYHVPVIGTIGAAITTGITKPGSYETGGGAYTGYDTAVDVTSAADIAAIGSTATPIDSEWTDCLQVREMIEEVRDAADVVCTPPTACTWPPSASDRVVFVDGDWVLGPVTEEGLLVVTGHFEMHGQAEWSGLIMVIGEGFFLRNGAGNGGISGGIMIADIAGPDNIYGTADDCTGGVGGFDQANFDESGGGTGDTIYCTDALDPARTLPPYKILEFVQR